MSRGWLAGLRLEARRALRGLAQAPGFAAGVVLVMGVAVAGTVTVATAAYQLFIRPLPFDAPEQLVSPTAHAHAMGFDLGLAPPMLAEVHAMSMVRGLGAYEGRSAMETDGGDRLRAAAITAGLPRMLGLSPVAGRAFQDQDALPAGTPVAMISKSLWLNRFAMDDSVIGSELMLDGRPLRVLGVMPEGFTIPSSRTDVWVPLAFTPDQLGPDQMGHFPGLEVIVRLRPGYSARQFQAALTNLYAGDERLAGFRDAMKLEFQARGLREVWTRNQREPVAIVGLAALFVLATAVLNLAGLWLARLLGRSHEQAVEAALGAGVGRRLARTAIEFLVVGLAGTLLAILAVPAGIDWLAKLGILDATGPVAVQAGPATLAVGIAVLLLAAAPVLVSAWWQAHRYRTELVSGLGGGGQHFTASRVRTRRILIVGQIALAMSLMSAMTLLLQSWHALLTEDMGFAADRLTVALVRQSETDSGNGKAADQRVADAMESLRGLPGVTSVTHTNVAPFAGSESVTNFRLDSSADPTSSAKTRRVGGDYFVTTGIDLLRGRSFSPEDAGGGRVIVDEHFASRYFPGGDAVGRHFELVIRGEGFREVEIIGVANTAKYRSPDEQPDQGTVYQYQPFPPAHTMLLIASGVSPAALVEPIRNDLMRSLGEDRSGGVLAMESLVRRTVRDREPQLILLGVFAAETLFLAAVGLFSLLSYSVRARTAEFGVRQAMGARPAHLHRHVLGEASRLLLPGLAFGVVGACLSGYLVADRLYDVAPADPATWLVTGAILGVVVLAAGLSPARRAARIQPTEALRYE